MRTLPVVVAALLLAQPALSAERLTAVLSHIEGKVKVRSTAAAHAAREGSKVVDGETVVTSAGALAVLTLPNGSQLKLDESSAIRLSPASVPEFELESGAVFARVRKAVNLAPGHHSFRIRTKTAVLGVRGTQFYTAFGREDGDGHDLWMCVHEGVVDVETLADHKSVAVKKGEGVLLPHGTKLTPPKPYDWTKKLNWNMDPREGKLANPVKIDSVYKKNLLKRDYN